MIFDSHAHYDDKRFNNDREEVLASLRSHGVGAVLNAACDMPSTRAALLLAETHDFIWSAAGVHPEHAETFDDAALEEIAETAKHERVVAIGEIGLDYHWKNNPPREVQRAAFERQLSLARDLDMPVIIHSRDAAQETFDIVTKYRPRGIVHCFSGSAELAREYKKMGMYIGFTGVVTFKDAQKPLAAAREAGLSNLLIETDCPYLAPVPFRSKRCDSGMLSYTVAALANALGVTAEEIIHASWENACAIYGVSPEK